MDFFLVQIMCIICRETFLENDAPIALFPKLQSV